MSRIVLNERDFALDALSTCSFGTSAYDTIGIVAKYYAAEGRDKSEIASLLERFIVRCSPDTNIVKWQDVIDKQIKNAKKNHLVEIEYIPITQKEIDACGQFRRVQLRRLLFTMICIAKYYNSINDKNNNWVNREYGEIFKLANVSSSISRQPLLIGDLGDAGAIKFSKRVDSTNINVCCIDNDGDAVLKITNFKNLGFQYLKYCGEPFFECECCGTTVKKTNNRCRYCSSCAPGVNAEKQIVRNAERRARIY